MSFEIEKILESAIDEKIELLEKSIFDCEQAEIPVIDRFSDGMYIREILIPKGTILTGRVHISDYADIMLSGDISIATKDGIKRYTGANVLQGKAGRKRAGYAHEDTRWVTVHNKAVQSGSEYIENYTFFSLNEYKNFMIEVDRISYSELVKELGMSNEAVDAQVKNTEDQLDENSEHNEKLVLMESKIHGIGLFSKLHYKKDDFVSMARVDGKRSYAGRYSNHSETPNCYMKIDDCGNVAMHANKNIDSGEELTTNYRHTILIGRGAICQQ